MCKMSLQGQNFLEVTFYDLDSFFCKFLIVDKAELLQLNHTRFICPRNFIIKKSEFEKTKTTFIISVLKVVDYRVYHIELVQTKWL